MNFKEHMKNNEDAKKVLLAVIKANLAKYIAGQELINRTLAKVKLPIKKCKKGKNKGCLICNMSKAFKVMTICQGVVQEGCKSYKLLFGETLNLDELVEEVSKDFFEGKAKLAGIKIEKGAIMPDDTPQEIRDIVDLIQSKLSGSGLNATVEVVDMKGNNYGLDPKDFASFPDYCRALSAAREAEAAGKTGEEILTEAVIHNAEEHANDTVKSSEKLN